MLRLGLLGQGISYSLSPQLFRWALEQCGLAGEYVLVDITSEEIENFVKTQLFEFNGLNVTIPHKQRLLEKCKELSATAQAVGAVNTLVISKSRLIGHNTDVGGVGFALSHLDNDKSVSNALIIGGGGAARAAIVAVQNRYSGVNLTVATRRVVPELQAAFTGVAFKLLSDVVGDLRAFNLVVQCTPVGGTKQAGLPGALAPAFAAGSLVLDMNYATRKSEFLELAVEQGAHVTNGMTMLLGQAARAFELWTGREFPMELALQKFADHIFIQ